ncbi:hypothetical protein ACF0H5_003303 [Mactra antiquata]
MNESNTCIPDNDMMQINEPLASNDEIGGNSMNISGLSDLEKVIEDNMIDNLLQVADDNDTEFDLLLNMGDNYNEEQVDIQNIENDHGEIIHREVCCAYKIGNVQCNGI